MGIFCLRRWRSLLSFEIAILGCLLGGCLNPGFAQPQPPDLATMWMSRHHGTLPVPGDFGAGGVYLGGKLQVLDNAALVTTVVVQPNGLNPSNLNLQWLFTTATNHTPGGVEFVVIYYQDQAPSLGVYDWSLVPPRWAWTAPLSDFVNNITTIMLPDGTTQSAIRYINSTFKKAAGWQNKVEMWDYVKADWSAEYIHNFSGPQEDCSQTGCAFWFNLEETFPIGDGPLPKIRPVGFVHTYLWHDGRVSWLGENMTVGIAPGAPWLVLDATANNTLVIGNE